MTQREVAADGLEEAARGRARLGWPCLLIGLVMFAVMVGATIPSGLYPLWRAEYDLAPSEITLVFSVYVIGVLTALGGFGALSDAIGRRPVLGGALALGAAADALFLLADGIGWLLVGRVLSGLATGLVTGTATAAMVDLAPPPARVRAARAALVANSAGLAGGPLLGGAFGEHGSSPLRAVFVVHLVLSLVAAAGMLVATRGMAPAAGGSWRASRVGVPAPVRAAFWPAAIAGIGGFAALGVLNTIGGLFAREEGLTDLFAVGAVIAIGFLTVPIGQVAGQALPLPALLPTACAHMVLAGGLNALALDRGWLAPFLIAAALNGLGIGMAIGAGLAAIALLCPPDRRGGTNSALFAVMYLGLSLPVIGTGMLIDRVGLRAGGVTSSLAVAGLAAAVGAVALIRLRVMRAGAESVAESGPQVSGSS